MMKPSNPQHSTKPRTTRPGATRESVGQRVTLPAFRQPVQTLRRWRVPLTVARTRWMLGSKRRLVIFFDHGRLLPKPGFLAQMSQTAATGLAPGWESGWGPEHSGQPGHDIRRTDARANQRTRPLPWQPPEPVGRDPRRVRDTMAAPPGGGVDPGVEPGVDLGVVRRFVDEAVDALAEAREEIDALNVFPVPDGDTGTNMYLTMSAARDAFLDAGGEGIGPALAAFRRGALLGARGNSGVILSQLLGALVGRIARARPGERNAVVMAEAMVEATDASYAAVGTPVEGTILTVARAASDAAVRRADDPGVRARDVFTAAADAARDALAHTPEQLRQLREAGVVDAGGRGLCVILDAAETVLTGRRRITRFPVMGTRTIPVPATPAQADDLVPDGPSYEVMYLLDADD